MSKTFKKCILVCSNHRSGSSALSGCLSLCGIDHGKDKNKEKNKWNEKGYFENDALYNFHCEVLKSIGQTWSSQRDITKEEDEILKNQFEGLVQLVNSQFDTDTFFIKDPRIVFLYPAYVEAFKFLEADPYLLWIDRDCGEVANSLTARSFPPGMCEDWGNRLCEKHRRRFRDFSSTLGSQKICEVSFNNLIEDPVATMKQIEKDFSLDFVSGNEEKITEFIDPKLKHF